MTKRPLKDRYRIEYSCCCFLDISKFYSIVSRVIYYGFGFLIFRLLFVRLRQDPLDSSFWSLLTFLHHGIDDIKRDLL